MVAPPPVPVQSAAEPLKRSCYGFDLQGLDLPRGYANPLDPRDLPVEVRFDSAENDPAPDLVEVGASHARIEFDDCRIRLRRGSHHAGLAMSGSLGALQPAAFLHPYLALPAAILGGWSERGSFHAAALLVRGVALAITAGPGGGKSSTSAAAAARGVEVLTDDLLVLDGTHVTAGPRCIDLRPDAADRFGYDVVLDAGSRTRYRRALPCAPTRAPLGGIVELAWGDRATVTRLAPSERGALWRSACALGDGVMPVGLLLDLVQRPGWRVTRVRDLTAVDDVVDVLTGLEPAHAS